MFRAQHSTWFPFIERVNTLSVDIYGAASFLTGQPKSKVKPQCNRAGKDRGLDISFFVSSIDPEFLHDRNWVLVISVPKVANSRSLINTYGANERW